MPDSTLSTLEQIQTKIRRLTRSPSPSQITNADLNNYINTFVLYDFPEHLRLFNLRTTLTFYTQPFIDTYDTDTLTPTDPLYNFKNKYISIHPPVYVAGFQILLSQSREEFFNIYPLTNSIIKVGTGDGVTTTFTGVINNLNPPILPPITQRTPFLQNNVLFSSIDVSSNGLSLIDFPVSASTGALGIPDAAQTLPSPFGDINYLTGAFTLIFPTAPASGVPINAQVIPYVPSRPQAMLFYDTKFVMRPVPDQPYRVNMEAYIRPTELLATNQMPELSEWWQYIAYGAAKKIFEDKMDLESVQMIMPEFKQQERLILRRTLVQQSNERTATIYTNNDAGRYGSGWYWGGGQF